MEINNQFIIMFFVQIIFLIVFTVFTKYDDHLQPKESNNSFGTTYNLTDSDDQKPSYAHFQDIHVMIFVGFGFLMAFLKKYGYSATGFNLLVAGLAIQWALITRACFSMDKGYMKLSLDDMIGADIASAVALISMGALLGRTTPIQLLIMSLFEIAVFAANEHLQIEMLKITDVGGSITVHAFGAYFGLAVSFMLRPRENENNPGKLEGPTYTSDIFAMIGTVFLWVFWPSFNSVLLYGDQQEMAILNTYLALAASTVTTFIMSTLVSHEHKLDMVHIQNSTLAGGVAVGSICNLLIGPHGAIITGIVAGIISVLGYRYLSPKIMTTLRIHDTCGVHNLHGMPAILSAALSGLYAMLASRSTYKDLLTEIFPAMLAINSTEAIKHQEHEIVIGGFGRTALAQGLFQLAGIASTLAFAIIGGLFTGSLIRSRVVSKLTKEDHHDDHQYWEVPASELNA